MVTTQDDDPFRRSYQYPRTKALKLSILGANIYVAVFQYRNKTKGKGWKTSSYNPFLMLHMNIFSGINIFQTISRTFFDSRHWGFVVISTPHILHFWWIQPLEDVQNRLTSRKIHVTRVGSGPARGSTWLASSPAVEDHRTLNMAMANSGTDLL